MKKILVIIIVLLSTTCKAQNQDSLIGHIFNSLSEKFPVYMTYKTDSTYALVDECTKVYFNLNRLETFAIRTREKKHSLQ